MLIYVHITFIIKYYLIIFLVKAIKIINFNYFHFYFIISENDFILSHIIHSTGYIGEFEIIDDHRSGKIVVQLNGRLNKTGVISPRFNVQVTQIESWVNLLLPARGFGIIILVRAVLQSMILDVSNL